MKTDDTGGLSLLQDDNVVSLIVAATSYCALVETDSTRVWTLESMHECRSILAGVYASMLRLPHIDQAVRYDTVEPMERIVTEESYRKVLIRLSKFFGEEDRFPEAHQEAQKLSERPVSLSVSELMADLYQALADPMWNIRQNGSSALPEILADLSLTFEIEWGKKLLSVLKQLHNLINNPSFEPSETALTKRDIEDYGYDEETD